MSRLTPEAERLIRASRAALKPSGADRERVYRALAPQLGGSGAESMAGPSKAPAASSATVAKATAALLAISVAGAGLIVALRTEAPPARPAPVAPATLDTVPQGPVDPAPERAPLPAPQTQHSEEKRAPAVPRSADSLAEEVAMLSQASTELHAGRPAAALTALDEHRRKLHLTAQGFGQGVAPEVRRALWAAPSAGAVAQWHALKSLAFFAGATGYLELSRPRLVIEGLGEVSQLGPVAVRIMTGAEWIL